MRRATIEMNLSDVMGAFTNGFGTAQAGRLSSSRSFTVMDQSALALVGCGILISLKTGG